MGFFSQRKGKNNRLLFYIKGYSYYLVPHFLLKRRLQDIVRHYSRRKDAAEIERRVNYYCQLEHQVSLPPSAPCLNCKSLKSAGSVYFFDFFRYMRYFAPDHCYLARFGDCTDVPAYPTIQKARTLLQDNKNVTLMKLDTPRHYVFLKDRIAFRDKKDKAIFRGWTRHKPKREAFLQRYHGHPLCDVGDTQGNPNAPQAAPLGLYEHLQYKFVFCLEGNDVATNLKWVMSSNSVAVMPRPTCETWFMEGLLKPNVHYIEIKADFSDVESRLRYYIEHPEEAEQIARNANAFVRQFEDAEREDIISLLVLQKYLKQTQRQDSSKI